jgi:Zn-dependent protease
MQCQKCGTETMMPFRCPFCGGQFCSAHRLPENHQCPRISNARAQTQQRVMTQQGDGSYTYTYVYGHDPYKKKRYITSSPKEIKHIGIAALLVIGIGYSMYLYLFNQAYWDIIAMSLFAGLMTVSFLVHEIAHKVTAQKAGLWAEFRLTTWGAVLTLISVFLPFKMISPGAMMIGGQPTNAKDMIKISIAGVTTNMILTLTFLSLAIMPMSIPFYLAVAFLAYINAFMAIFNLIPFGILDGYKLFVLNKKIWAGAFIISIVLVIVVIAVFPFIIFG